jgi:radical SAM-linked protein
LEMSTEVVMVVMRIRSRFKKYGLARYVSHIDMIRVFERAMRRADIPLAYSQGYHPHPMLSFSPALAVGVTSDAEYMDVALTDVIDIDEFNMRLNTVLPEGFSIVRSRPLLGNEKSITGIVCAGIYEVGLRALESISEAAVLDGVQRFLERKELMVLRETKKDVKEVDIRQFIHEVAVREVTNGMPYTMSDGTCISLDMLVSVGSHGNIKPEEVVSILSGLDFWGVQLLMEKIHRKELFVLVNEKLIQPV